MTHTTLIAAQGQSRQPLGSRSERASDELNAFVDRTMLRVKRERGGTEYPFRDEKARGYAASLTNVIVRGDLRRAIRAVVELGHRFAEASPLMRSVLAIGWWRDDAGALYVDLGLVLPSALLAFAIGEVFRQRSIALLEDDQVKVLDVEWQGISHPSPLANDQPAAGPGHVLSPELREQLASPRARLPSTGGRS